MVGVMAFWMGIMEIASRAGIIEMASKKMRPLIRFLFPDIPKEHQANQYITTNFIANFLGLGWAAKPAGLQGMQALAEVFGATVSHAPTIMHGKTSLVEHIDDEIFAGVANPMTATRYHSLAVEPDTVPDDLVVTAWTKDDHIVQGIKHRSLPMYAVQFHPESVMTQDGYRLLANWLAVCGQTNAVAKSIGLQPKVNR